MKILCLGHASYDITSVIDNYPVQNKKNRFITSNKCGGGPVANASYLLGKWNVPNVFAGVVGNDEYGQKIKEEFSKVKIDTRFIETDYNRDTSLSIILVDKLGNRTNINLRQDALMLTKYNIDFIPDIILTDANDFLATKNLFNKYTEAITILDAGRLTPEILEIARKVKILICSKEFAEDVTKMKFNFDDAKSISNIYQTLKNSFKGNVIVTLEEKGALYNINNQIRLLPGIKTEVVDPTGAGDIFRGAFVYGLSQGYNIEKSIKIANIASGLSLKKIGGRSSIPEFNIVKEYYESKEGPIVEQTAQNTVPVAPITSQTSTTQNVPSNTTITQDSSVVTSLSQSSNPVPVPNTSVPNSIPVQQPIINSNTPEVAPIQINQAPLNPLNPTENNEGSSNV